MRISKMIKQLEEIKEKYGDVECVYGTGSSYEVDSIKIQKCVKYINDFYNQVDMDIEDLDEDYLEKTYKEKVLESQVVVLIY